MAILHARGLTKTIDTGTHRVEILRDGASAVYGSDAAAGVLNNRINRNFNGRGFTLKGSATQHGGANEFNASAYQGFTTGKTHIAASVDYFHRDALAAHDRWFARNSDLRVSRTPPAPWNGLPVTDPVTGTVYSRDNDFRNANSVNQWGQWQRGFIQPDFLTFVDGFTNERELAVWQAIETGLRAIHRLLDGDALESFQRTVADLVEPALERLGWRPAEADKAVDELEIAVNTYVSAPETDRARRVLSKLRQVPRLVQAARDEGLVENRLLRLLLSAHAAATCACVCGGGRG